MGKIVNINENDLKRIVKRVLNERQQLNDKKPLNEWVLTTALVLGGIWAGAEIGKWWSSAEPSSRAKQLYQNCNKMELGKGMQTDDELSDLADEYHEACPSKDRWVNCKEDEMKRIHEKIQSVPDFCKFTKIFTRNGYGDWYEITDSAMDVGSGWDEYVNAPLGKNAIKNTAEAIEQNKGTEGEEGSYRGDAEPKPGSGSSSTASGDGSVSDLQRLLKDKGFDIGSYGVDGKFGKDTLTAAIKALRTLK